jgi:NAD(P)-dependent dehydrogenase (short-subunit alcohol dehydrogenase family)
MQDLSGLTGVVTGGGDGIGRALALELAGQGMNVAVLDIREAAAEETAAACRAKRVRSMALRCDVTVFEDMEAAAGRVQVELGPVKLIWANAGVVVQKGITTAKAEEFRWMYAVNVEGTLNTILAFVPAMKAQTGWRWVGVTASAGGLGMAKAHTAYCTTKFAGVAIAEALREELSDDGIGVTLACPGIVNTRIWDGRRARPERFGGAQYAPEEAGERWRIAGMDADAVSRIAVEGLRRGDFYVIASRTAARTEEAIDRRHEELRRAIGKASASGD